jgi:putative FmdB family regulatory protein
MPIYSYKCASCGCAKDVLQKMSDAPLQICPSCAKPTFNKQLTAAGFQLKGSGWYATDFKGGSSAPSETDSGTQQAPEMPPAPPPTATATDAPVALPAPAASGV